jgi:cytosine/adenosine deaminase-related metal-dependent hydrolase
MDGPATLPRRGHLVIRKATVLTMDPAIGELADADIEIRDGAIAAVGPDLPAAGAETIDGDRMIALPGFVDTHWHLWGTLLRGVIGDGHANGWFARKAALAPHFAPEDTAAGARLALLEGIAAGFTTVHDWAHNVLGPNDAEANVAADLSLGARVHWSWGLPSTTPGLSLAQMSEVMARVGKNVDEPIELEPVVALRDRWLPRGDGLLSVGVNLRGPARSTADVYRHEFAEARRHGLPIAMHCAGTRAEIEKIRQVRVLADDGLLGPDLLLAHGNHMTAEDIELAAAAGTPISISPMSELRLAMGFLQVREFEAAGIRTSMSLDTTAISANADPFAAMRVAVGLEGVRNASAESLSPRRVLEMATVEGARSLGLGDLTGSLTPGKRADLILVRADTLGVAPVVDPAVAIVHSATPADVDTVIVDGRALKQAGRLTATDSAQVVAEAEAGLRRVAARAGFDLEQFGPRAAPAAAAALA